MECDVSMILADKYSYVWIWKETVVIYLKLLF